MIELRRILTDKRYIITFVLLIAANIMIFQEANREKLARMGSEEDIRQYVSEYKEINEHVVSEYYERVDNIENNAGELSSISIFADSDSFSGRNIQKTVNDYRRIQDVKVDNIFGVAVDSIIEYKPVHLSMLIHMFVLILMLFDERKKGLWSVVYTSRNGRVLLSVYRGIALVICNILFGIAAYGSVILTSLLDYDSFYILSKPVQCIAALQRFTLPMNIAGFLIYYVLWQVMTSILMSFIIWFIFSIIHNRTYAFVITAMLFLIGYYTYKTVNIQSPLCILRYVNLYHLCDITEVYSSYYNFRLGSLILNNREFTEKMCLMIFPLSVLCVVANMCVRPVYKAGILERLFVAVSEMLHKRIKVLHGFGYEMYKYLVLYKGIYVLIILAYISFQGMGINNLTRSEYYKELKEFYQEYSGAIDGERLAVYEQMVDNIKHVDTEFLRIAKDYKEGRIDIVDYTDALLYYKSFDCERKLADELGKIVDNRDVIESRGVQAWFVDSDGIDHLVGDISFEKRMVNNIMTLFVVMLLFLLFEYDEKRSEMKYLIGSCAKGRRYHNVMVTGASLLLSAISCTVVFGMECYDVWYSYGFGDLGAPIQNISGFLNFPLHISTGLYVFLRYAGRYIVITCAGLVLQAAVRRMLNISTVNRDKGASK